ncbi:MAG TPA: chloride channel protein, partial [Daejeonella sp.]|nr:chloride channel protein [Daejeonella sp.]
EAMEQILVNQSKIKPSITYLKPLSSAISIGTGGPFGAEGPIIATGGALGSTIGQLFKVTPNERKIILAAGATAGMSAIFGSPIAAIFLAIELLLFEFSPKSIIPVALACITGAAGHHLLFGAGPVFPMPDVELPSNMALALYSVIGILIGLLSLGITKIVYYIEDGFEKLPVHWVWWPVIGGLAVGVIGYFYPYTLGVGYENITRVLSGDTPLIFLLSLCFFKFLSWAIALGSGTSGGTLAPLLTIGGAAGAILGIVIQIIYPDAGVVIPIAAMVGMAAMFAGASRAFLTSIAFALETTMQSNALLPLLGACTASYLVSFFFMRNTIMTEKIARRGIHTPHSFEPDLLEKLKVRDITGEDATILSADNTIAEVREWLNATSNLESNYFVVVNSKEEFIGTISLTDVVSSGFEPGTLIASLIKHKPVTVRQDQTLRQAVELMAQADVETIPVISADNTLSGILTFKDIIASYKSRATENAKAGAHISLKKQSIRILIKGQKALTFFQTRKQ